MHNQMEALREVSVSENTFRHSNATGGKILKCSKISKNQKNKPEVTESNNREKVQSSQTSHIYVG